MSYLALARKWRPRTFSELFGQEHVSKALINSLNRQRIHHAYLFTGTRGVGKTTVARLMAKALNCEQGISANPCLHCDACMAIEQGRFIDLIEIDGASKTRVEDTRELMDNVIYAPTNARFKIYLIDEVHMLSQHSFNALLKTLEEPPEHVKFLLATTEIQKLPMTVLSRCLQFSLKPISRDIIKSKLALILQEEQLAFEEEALLLLAKAAKGSMRDALSLLDCAIAASDGRIESAEIKNTLGYTEEDYALHLLQSLAAVDAKSILSFCRQIAQAGGNFAYVLEEMLQYLHQMMLCQAVKEEDCSLLDIPESARALAKAFQAEDIQLFYQIGLKGTKDMHLAPTLAMGFEMTVLRMLTFRPLTDIVKPPLAFEAEPATGVTPKMPENWETILQKIKLSGLALTAAENARMLRIENGEIILNIDKRHQSLFTPMVTERIEQALTTYYKTRITICLQCNESLQSTPAQKKRSQQQAALQEAAASLQGDVFLQQVKQEFFAEEVKNSVELLNASSKDYDN